MVSLRKEIRDLVRVCEVIQALVAQGETLSVEEEGVIEICLMDLLGKVKSTQKPSDQ